MYIPIRAAESPDTAETAGSQGTVSVPTTLGHHSAPCAQTPAIGRLGTLVRQFLFGAPDNGQNPRWGLLRKRQYNGNEAHDLNVTIGIVVGVLIGAFVIGIIVFLYFFGNSIRFTEKRKVRRKSSGGSSKSSKSSSSGRSVPPPPPPPGPPTAPPPP